MHKKKVFITGIAGFIGMHLALALQKRGDDVWGCDTFNAYYDPALKQARAALLKRAKVRVIQEDICNQGALKTLLQEQGTTHVAHMAAQAGVRASLKDPESYIHSNLVGFASLLEALRAYAKAELIYASSSSVYGLNTKIPFAESDPTDRPANLYAASKKGGEMLAFSYHHLYQIPMRALRFFTVYGPWGRPDMAYYAFTDKILKGEEITLFHQGKMERDFTFIDDIVSGIISAIDLSAPYEVFNLGNHCPESVLTLLALLEEKLKQKAKVQHQPKRAEEVETTFADIAKAQKQLGFNPKTTLSAGLNAFLEWHASYHSNLFVRESRKRHRAKSG